MSRPDAAQAFAEHVAGTRFEDLSPQVVERAKVFILDTIAVGIAGSSVQGADALRRAAAGWGAGDGASVWGAGVRLPPAQAAMVNAFQIHAQEFDALHERAVLHAPATLLAALLADAETRRVSGRDLIAAFVAGVDVACGLGLAAKQGLRFFRPASAGGFGAAAGVARLRGFGVEQTLAALGHQLGQACGTMQGHTEGSPLLPIQIGTNARAAIMGCDLVEAGIRSVVAPFEGPYGYLPMFEGEYDIAPVLADLPRVRRVMELSHKPYPSGRATHGGIEGLMRLRAEYGFAADEVREIVVIGPPLILRLVNRPAVPSPDPSYARLCMPFALAKVLQHGALDPAHARGDALSDPETFAIAQRVRMESNGGTDPNTFSPTRVEVRLTDGRLLACDLPELLASPERPLPRAMALAKVARCLELAAARAPALDRLVADIEELDRVADVGALVRSWA